MKKLLTTIFLTISSFATANTDIIKFVSPFGPGGQTDNIIRTIQNELRDDIVSSMILEHKPGAGGEIANRYTATNKTETVILLASINLAFSNIKPNPNYDYKDLIPVAYLGNVNMILVFNPNTNIKNKNNLLQSKQEFSIGTGLFGTPTHIVSEIFFYKNNLRMVAIPYKASPGIITDLVENRIDASLRFTIDFQQYIRDNKVTAIAVFADNRLKKLPDIPTTTELGLKNSVYPTWNILVASPGSDPKIISKIRERLARIYSVPELAEKFSNAIDLELDPSKLLIDKDFVKNQIIELENYAKNIPNLNLK